MRVWRSRCFWEREETDDFSDMRELDISEMACFNFSGEVTMRARVLTISCFVFCSTYSLFVCRPRQMGEDSKTWGEKADQFLSENVLFAF